MLSKKKLVALAAGSLFVVSTQMNCEVSIHERYPLVVTSGQSIDTALKAYEHDHGLTPELSKVRVLQRYFTPQACAVLQKIPVVTGRTKSGYAAHATGRNATLSYFENLFGYGFGKKTVLRDEADAQPQVLVHEFTHHASALSLIDDNAFDAAWQMMAQDPKYQSLTELVDDRIDRGYPWMIMAAVPLWRTVEREAILAEHILFYHDKISDCMKDVYKKTLRF